ncbi:hypothetical protein PISMIDRAFT_11943 [Pisolithus microcarpus 441]|uniref:Uncharacterized protein n=1 Tax=Pisolithus microcarpus 441 TaxID=765257 RepID=A0A0C9ZQC2_9AGAM|nr:hypothetical protein BKA83DRAFT_11943 [Pisolithus microcarpus]KIK21923.1 hypothetical protein PISMIDRAFT_11943 [Pisolithus microcarpus 441]
MTSHPIALGQSVVRLEKSYVVVLVSPVEEAYGSFIPVQYQLLSSTPSDHTHNDFETLLPALIGEDGPSSSLNPPEH